MQNRYLNIIKMNILRFNILFSIFSAKKWLSTTAMKLFSSSEEDLEATAESEKEIIEKSVEISQVKRGRGRPRKDPNAPKIMKSNSDMSRRRRRYELRGSSSLRSSKSNADVAPNDGQRRFLLTYKALPKNLQILAKINYPEAHNMYEEHRIVCRIINDNTPKPKEIFIPTFRRLAKPRNLKDVNRREAQEDDVS